MEKLLGWTFILNDYIFTTKQKIFLMLLIVIFFLFIFPYYFCTMNWVLFFLGRKNSNIQTTHLYPTYTRHILHIYTQTHTTKYMHPSDNGIGIQTKYGIAWHISILEKKKKIKINIETTTTTTYHRLHHYQLENRIHGPNRIFPKIKTAYNALPITISPSISLPSRCLPTPICYSIFFGK